MRKLNWDEPLSDEDFAWIRQSGIPGLEDRAVRHQERFKADVPDPSDTPEDILTRSALDPQGRVADRVPEFSQLGAPQLVDPTKSDEDNDESDEGDDDYDSWSKQDLENEVGARDAMPDTTMVTVEGTGKDGNVLKPDLIKGLRLWDQENPGAL